MFKLLYTVLDLRHKSMTHEVRDTFTRCTKLPVLSIRQLQKKIICTMVFDDSVIPSGYKSASDSAKDEAENAILSRAIENMNLWNDIIAILNVRRDVQ